MKKAVTLMEVNLAIMIMAGGILSVLGLYSLGYRENRQSREDVASAAYADAVMSPLVMALSATNVTWSAFRSITSQPSERGWYEYLNAQTGMVNGDPEGKAKAVFSSVMGKLGSTGVASGWPTTASGGLKAGLVVLHDEDSAVVRIAFRATKNPAELLAMPIYYTEVRFQGVQNQ
ncbi:MAG: hypothetical protein IJI73_00605 [Kiritimatiellae bacterium]|nr:hypothetical protein [Kiritimatiellia bacterium]